MQVLINLFQFCNWVEFAWIENWNWVLQIALGLQPLRQFNQHLIPRLPNPAMLLKKIWDVFFCFILLVLQATTKVAINQLWNYSRETTKTLHIVRFVVSDAAQLSSNTMRFLILNWHTKYFFNEIIAERQPKHCTLQDLYFQMLHHYLQTQCVF